MLYINIDEQVKIKNYTYSANYIDCPNFTFIKRISRCKSYKDVYIEEGIDFSESLYFYSEKYKKGETPYDIEMYSIEQAVEKFQNILNDFVNNNVIQKMQDNIDGDSEKIILERLFREVYEKIIKKT